MKSVVKKKRPVLSAKHRRDRMDFALTHKDWTVEDWKRVVWSDETKIDCMGSDGKKAGEGLSDRVVQGTRKFGGGSLMLWGCMLWEGVGYACKIDGRMDGELYVKILQDELQEASFTTTKPRTTSSFSKITTPSTLAIRPETGFKIMTSMSCYGQHTLQTSIPLSTSGIT
jgi:hypothetical protein